MLLLAAALLPSPLDRVLESPLLHRAIVAAFVASEDGATVYERNADQRVVPASNQKLLTAAFSLHRLGDRPMPPTLLWRDGDDCWVASAGSPMLTHAQIAEAARRLGRARIVHVVQKYSPGFHGDWELDDLPNKYAAAVTSFTVDRGSFELWAENGRAFFLPRNYGAKIIRRRASGPRRVRYDPMSATAYVDGELPKTRTRLDTLALPQPDRNAASILGERFARADEPPARVPDLVLPGATLEETLRECMVRSDNNIAEHLLLMSAGRTTTLEPAAPYAQATHELRDFLVRIVGLEASGLRMADGSGLSRHNVVTARGIGALLLWALRQPTASTWLASLPRPGEGTLASRLKDTDVSAKTGTLDMASSLSGYVRAAGGRRFAFSLILNHYACTAAEARAIQDEFVKTLIAMGGSGTALAIR